LPHGCLPSTGAPHAAAAPDRASAAAPAPGDDGFAAFAAAAATGANVVPLYQRIFSDQLSPVTAYRCLVKENDIDAPSFLLESVVNGDQQGRYSFVGAMPSLEIVATRNKVTVLNHVAGTRRETQEEDPMQVRMASPLWRHWLGTGRQGYSVMPDGVTG
jgi:anthranilate synthase component 1